MLSASSGVLSKMNRILGTRLIFIDFEISLLIMPENFERIFSFNSPKFGQVAGCIVVEGTVLRNKPVRVLRDDIVIFQGELDSLRRFKDDVNEVKNGTECGMGIKNYKDIREGDKIEVFDRKEESQSI